MTELRRERGGRRFKATIRKGKGVVIHLGLYETPWQAACAFAVAAEALRRDCPPWKAPVGEEPSAFEVRTIGERVRARLELNQNPRRGSTATRMEQPPSTEDLLVFFEITVVGFWRREATSDQGDQPGAGLDAAAGRLYDAARLLFWSPSAGHPDPLAAMTELLVRRLDRAFGHRELTREVLGDDGDDPLRVAGWLVLPDDAPGDRARGFRTEVIHRYAEFLQDMDLGDEGRSPGWATSLGVSPPITLERVREAYRARSRTAHPDAGGSPEAFVRLRRAYEEALAYCELRGLRF